MLYPQDRANTKTARDGEPMRRRAPQKRAHYSGLPTIIAYALDVSRVDRTGVLKFARDKRLATKLPRDKGQTLPGKPLAHPVRPRKHTQPRPRITGGNLTGADLHTIPKLHPAAQNTKQPDPLDTIQPASGKMMKRRRLLIAQPHKAPLKLPVGAIPRRRQVRVAFPVPRDTAPAERRVESLVVPLQHLHEDIVAPAHAAAAAVAHLPTKETDTPQRRAASDLESPCDTSRSASTRTSGEIDGFRPVPRRPR